MPNFFCVEDRKSVILFGYPLYIYPCFGARTRLKSRINLTQSAAYATNPEIAEYILLSVKKNMSYDALEVKWELREVEQMPCCRTDFYGYRRLFYHNLDSILREKNGTNEITTKECTVWH